MDHVCVVLVSTRNPLNIGAAARAMSNFGFSNLRVVHPYGPSFREARSAVGAADVLAAAQEYSTVGEAVSDCTLVVGTTAAQNREIQHPLRGLESGTLMIRKQLASGRVALLFGSEKVGLSNEEMSHCHWLMQIPTRQEHRSMNLGQAVAVCLYELIRSAVAEPKAARVKFSAAADLERITMLLVQVLRLSDYANIRPASLMEEKIRRLICRLVIPAPDAEVWLGMLRQILWKLKGK